MINQQSIFDSLMPNVYVSRVSVSEKSKLPDKNRDKNPHILEESDILEQLSNWASGQAGYYMPPNPTQLNISLDMVIKDLSMEENQLSKWFSNQKFQNYVNIYVFQVDHPGAYRQLLESGDFLPSLVDFKKFDQSQGKAKIFDKKTSNNIFVNYKRYALADFVSKYGTWANNPILKREMEKFVHIDSSGIRYYEIPFSAEFEYKNEDPNFLSYIIIPKFNIEKMTTDLGLGDVLTEQDKVFSFGNPTGEIVYKDGELVQSGMLFRISDNQGTNGAVFRDQAGEIWLGPTHKHKDENGVVRYMGGKQHTNMPHPFLDHQLVENRKIQDFRQIKRVEKEYFDFSSLHTSMTLGGVKYLTNRKKDSDMIKKSAVFSPLYACLGREGFARLMFGVDFGQFFKENCALPGLVDKLSDPEAPSKISGLFAQSKLLNFKITRERVDSDGTSSKEKSGSDIVYASGFPLVNTHFDTSSTLPKPPGEEQYTISRLKPIHPTAAADEFFNYYTFTDFSITNKQEGLYKYSIEMEYTDPTVGFLSNILDTLRTALYGNDDYAGLYSYFQKASVSRAFNSYTGKFSPAFVEQIYDSKDFIDGVPVVVHELINSDKFTLLMSIVKGINLDKGVFIGTFRRLLRPEVASPDSISATISMVEKMANNIQKQEDSFSAAKVPKINEMKAGYTDKYRGNHNVRSKSSTVKRIMSVTHSFNEYLDKAHPQAGYDFLYLKNTEKTTPPTAAAGLMFMSDVDYKARVRLELEKYFTTEAIDNLATHIIHTTESDEYHGGKASQWTMAESRVDDSAYGHLTLRAGTAGMSLPLLYADIGESQKAQILINILRFKKKLVGNMKPTEDPHNIGEFSEKLIQLLNSTDGSIPDSILGDLFEGLGAQIKSFPMSIPFLGGENQPPEKKPPEEGTAKAKRRKMDATNRFLTALIFLNEFDLDDEDFLLDSFNLHNEESKIRESLVGDFFGQLKLFGDAGEEGAMSNLTKGQEEIERDIKELPPQIRSLLLMSQAREKDKATYANGTTVNTKDTLVKDYYSGKGPFIESKLTLSQYPSFFLNHQNIASIQYLSGYRQANLNSVMPAETYEAKFPSLINEEAWHPLTKEAIDTMPFGRPLFCRVVRYHNSELINEKVTEKLDMRFYNQYFMLFSGIDKV